MIPLCSILSKGEAKKAPFQQPSLADVLHQRQVVIVGFTGLSFFRRPGVNEGVVVRQEAVIFESADLK